MRKATIYTIIIGLIFLSAFVSAANSVEVRPIENPGQVVPANIDNNSVAVQYQQILARLSRVEQQVNQAVTKDEFQQGVNFVTQELANFIEAQNQMMIIAMVLVIIFAMGMAFGIYLYLVSQRRLAGRTSQNDKGGAFSWLK